MSDELFSVRSGRLRNISSWDFAELIWMTLDRLWSENLFAEALTTHLNSEREMVGPSMQLAEAEFLRRLKTRDVYERLTRFAHRDESPPSHRSSSDALFDALEFLHDEAVSLPVVVAEADPPSNVNLIFEDPARRDASVVYSKPDGRTVFREALNPDLALFDPPMELSEGGHVIQLAPNELRPLLDDPVPDDVPRPLRDPLRDAIGEYRARGASDYDRRSALKHLADVLEPLRDRIDETLLNRDTSALFQIANQFWIRHNNRNQMRGWDSEIWLDWIFYVYVATARALLETYDRQELAESVFGPEPDDNGGLPL